MGIEKKNKLTLLLELKNKLFNNKLSDSRKKLSKATGFMRDKIRALKGTHLRAFQAMSAEIPLFGRAMELLGNPYVLMIGGLVALTALFGKATNQARRFNYEFLQIRQLNLDKNTRELGKYKEQIRDTAFRIGTDLGESTKAFYDLQSATGVYGDDAVAIFEKVGRYSIATGAKIGDSINSTTKAMKAYGLGVQDIDRYLISNAKTVQVGITTFDELARVQTEYAGAVAGAGQDFNTGNKIFAAFTSIAKDSNTAATMTKSAFEGLTQANTVKGLKSIGISLYDSKGQMRDLSKVMEEVSGKFKKMTPKQIDQLINEIGGPEGLRNLFIKLKTGADDFHKTLTSFDASQYNLDQALKNAKGDVTVLSSIVKNQLNTTLSKLGEMFLPLIARGLEKISLFLEWLYPKMHLVIEGVKMLGIFIASYTSAWLIWKGVIIASSIASMGLTGALGAVKLALLAIRVAIFNIPIVGWIAAAVTALVVLYQKWDGFRAVVDASWQVIKTFFTNMWNGIKTIGSGIMQYFEGVGQVIKAAVSFDWEGIKNGAKNALGGLKNVGLGLLDVDPTANLIKNFSQYGEVASKAFNESLYQSKKRKADEAVYSIIDKQKGLGLISPEGSGLNDLGNPIGDDGSGKGDTTANDINRVAGSASGPTTINVTIEAFNKGGINTQNTTLSSMTTQEIEEWFEEKMMRLVRNLEMSYGR